MTGITKENLGKLQKVQNAAARFINGQRQWRGTTQLRKALHFLPVNERIKFKTCVLVYKCLNGLAPDYLSERICRRKKKVVSLRADEDDLLLDIPNTRYRSTERAFRVAGPRLWNKLPRNLRESETLTCFKKGLKTALFAQAFET